MNDRVFDFGFLAPIWRAYRADLLRLALLGGLGATIVISLLRAPSTPVLAISIAIALGVCLAVPVTRRRPGMLAAVVILIPASFLGLECVFRLRYFGVDAIASFGHYTPNLTVSKAGGFGNMRVSEDERIGLELRPGFEGWSKGTSIIVNSHSYREREFTLEKPPGVIRILLFGDSIAMGSGVKQSERLTDFAETMLNEQAPPDIRFQVLNCAIGGDTLERGGARLQRDTERFNADAAVLAFASFRAGESIEERVNWARKFETNERLARELTPIRQYSFIAALVPRASIARVLEMIRSNRQLKKGDAPPLTLPIVLEQVKALENRTGTPIAVMILRKIQFPADVGLLRTISAGVTAGDPERLRDHQRVQAKAEEFGVPFIDTFDAFPDDARKSEYVIFPGDGHPNSAGHRAYARALVQALLDPNLHMLPPEAISNREPAASP